jgi:hypothetical protein
MELNTVQSGIDSRQYLFSFPIQATAQVPADFLVPGGLPPLLAGVFLPQADVDWLGRRKYPARILLLAGQELVIAAHPSAREPPVRVALDRIESLECGRILLLGWIALTWDAGRKRLPFNTTARGPVEAFMEALKSRWLRAAPNLEAGQRDASRLDLKFEYARSAELLCGEIPLVQFFHPSVCQKRRRWGLCRERWLPGDLLAATSRRLLWITERHKGQWERYGTVSHSVPLASITGVRCVWAGRCGELQFAFRCEDSWHVPLREGEEQEAQEFAAAVRARLVT